MSVLIDSAKQALAQSQAMYNAAKSNDWESVQEIQVSHSQLVSQLVIADVSPELSTELRPLLEQIRVLNSKTEALAETVKKGLIQEQKNLDKANKMQNALDAFK
ncbi:MAG: hypothetical protein CSA60_03240 [Neptuniibacter caesariensis]|uniref:Flagellar protein FliT n=1 Tax=Neptuniibacter caesariensis TaxID=207954 RepID=A0A2G6JMC6_NEPCE|nr:MAG: hypothetical protein CSA60_03240 [Neptuniibacter caesariensis]